VSKSFTPLVNNFPVKIAPELNQPLFQFNIVNACVVNTFLCGRPHLIVNWIVI